jgi:hypothetical protein
MCLTSRFSDPSCRPVDLFLYSGDDRLNTVHAGKGNESICATTATMWHGGAYISTRPRLWNDRILFRATSQRTFPISYMQSRKCSDVNSCYLESLATSYFHSQTPCAKKCKCSTTKYTHGIERYVGSLSSSAEFCKSARRLNVQQLL